MRSYLLVMLVAGEVLAQGRPEVPAHFRNQSIRTRRLTVDGTANLATFVTSGLDAGTVATDALRVRGNASIGGNLSVDGGTWLAGDAGVGGDLNVGGSMEAAGDLGSLGRVYGDEVVCLSVGDNCFSGNGSVQMNGRGWFYSGMRVGLGSVTPTVEIEDGVGTARIFVGGAGSPLALPLSLAGRNDAGVAVSGPLQAGNVWTPDIGNPDGGPLVVSGSSLQAALLDAGTVRATAANIGTLDAGTARFGTASAASFVNRGEYGFSYPTPSVLLPCGHADAGFGTIIRWQGAYGGEDWQCTEGSYLACPGCWGPPHNTVNTFAAYGPDDPGSGNSSGIPFRSTDPGTHPSVIGSIRVKIVRAGSCGGSCTANIARGRIYQSNKADGGQRDLVTFAMPCNVAVGQCAQYSNIYPGGQPASSGCTLPITVLTHALTFEEGGAVVFEFQPDGGAAQQCTDNPEPSIFGYTYRFMFPDAGGG